MMKTCLILVATVLSMSFLCIDARAAVACTQTCYDGARAYLCCRTNEQDIAGGNGSVSQQRNSTATNPFRQKRSVWPIAYIPYLTHDGFTAEQEAVICDAMQVVVNRLFTPRVRDCAYRGIGNLRYKLRPGVYERSNIDGNSAYNGYKDLLKFQLDCLEMKAMRHTFPKVHIRPWYEKSGTVAKGALGCVTVASKGSECTTTGEFKMWLNLYHLAVPTQTGANADYWGGVIVHEMLHNLGHSHGDYTDSWQINVFEKCLAQNGNYSPGFRASLSNYLHYIFYH